MNHSMTGILIALIGILALISGGTYVLQPAMVFFPSKELQATPADWGLDYEDVWIEASDGVRLHAWYVPRAGARRVVLFFHGNAGNISHRGESVAIFHRMGLNVLILDYRGYGRSEGSPSEEGLYRDARAAWDYLLGRAVQSHDIVVFGRSLGGIVAAWLAAEVGPAALILESTLSSARDFIRAHYGFLSWLIPNRYGFDTLSRMQAVHCPVLVLHSPDDEIMPFALGEKVYHAARTPKAFVTMRGDHNSGFIDSQPSYERSMQAFLAEHLPSP